MKWFELYSQETPPTDRQVADYINNPCWAKLNEELQQAYKIAPKTEYSRCSMQKGWNVKYKKSGKALCTLYPMENYFIAMVVIGAKEMNEAELFIPLCSEYVQNVFEKTGEFQGQKWLMLDVKNETTLRDILGLIALRVKPKTGE